MLVIKCLHGVMVSALDSHQKVRGSNPGMGEYGADIFFSEQ